MDPRRHVILRVLAALVLWSAAIASEGIEIHAAPASPRWFSGSPGRPLSLPVDVAIDRKGVAYLLDSGNRTISLFSPRGEYLREINGAGLWKDPVSLAVASDGALFLADGESGHVLEVDRTGKVRRRYFAGKGARVTGVAVYGEFLYGADNRNCRVIVFRRGGGPSGRWGGKGSGPGEFQSPFRIVADSAGRIFVTDVMNGRVQWFSAFGKHLGTLKVFGAASGKIFRPTGIALDPRGRIWVTDSFTGLVQLFSEEGRMLRVLTGAEGVIRFADPVGVAVGPGGIWVTDQREGRAALFRNTE